MRAARERGYLDEENWINMGARSMYLCCACVWTTRWEAKRKRDTNVQLAPHTLAGV